MKSIKKIFTIAAILLSLAAVSNAADFTFQGYTFGSAPILNINQEINGNVSNLIFTGSNSEVNDKINKRIKEVLDEYSKDGNSVNRVLLAGNNSKFLSVVISHTVNNETELRGLNFDVLTGKELSLSDIFNGDYNEILKDILNQRIAQFGLKTNKSFNGMRSVSSFYLEDDSIVLIFNKGVATDDNDGIIHIPFFLTSLQEILK